jgi:hypothetical protein
MIRTFFVGGRQKLSHFSPVPIALVRSDFKVSPSTVSHDDHVRKRRIYERAGVKEYWLVHPIDRMVTIYCLLLLAKRGVR